ncbi:hypothetical protein PSCICJ_22120 [Pseudomonas cichorii]|nr:hypothetical protein PSCICJ_22120 [Pseudomonas cichorii]
MSSIDLNGSRLTAHQFSGGRERQRQQGLLLSQYQYDEQGRLQAHSVSQQDRSLFQRRYAYDANGNLAGIDDSRKGNRSFHYDPLDRLINVRGNTPETFAHDPAGNLLGQGDLPTANLANVKGNRLLMQGDRHYDYDAYGNQIRERRGAGQKLVTEYRYDAQHRLIGVSLPGGSTATYKYDAFGRRIAKTVDGHTTEFLWQGERLVAESAENRYRSYIYEPGTFRPLAMLDGEGPRKATPFYYQLDHLGTSQELTDYSGEILWSAKYRAYGNLAALDVAEIDNPLRFQGQYFDAETGLHYNRHRYYNPGTGRFLTPDPIKLAGGLNNYRYVPNPTGWVDPLGLDTCPRAAPKKSTSEVEDPAAAAKVEEGAPDVPGKYAVGPYDQMRSTVPGLDAHHVGQKALLLKMIPGYNPDTAPSILVPKVGHTIKGPRGIVSRSTTGLNNPREVLARDIFELRRVYTDIPNKQLQKLIKANKDSYPEAYSK